MSQADKTTSLEGTIVGGTYRVGKCIGQGAMGAVFAAEHLRLAGRYAIKVLQPDIAAHPDVLSRFQREATITSQLRHPNIVSVLDFNVTPDGRPFLAMELLDGVELTDAIEQAGPMPLARVLDIVGQVVSALSAAHALGIVHRDLKPQNLFLLRLPGDERQVVKVLDFGISKVHEATTLLTQAHAVIGTPQYMAPEQALGQVDLVDHRVDQFALGAITYELLTGRTPFRGDSIPAVLYQVVHEQPPSIRSFNQEISAAVEAVVMRAMAKKPGDRYPAIRDFHAALTQADPVRGQDERSSTDTLAAAAAAKSTGHAAVVATRKSGVETTFSTAATELGAETLAPLRSHRTRLVVAGVSVVLVGIGWVALRSREPRPASVVPRPPVEVAPPVVVKAPAPTPSAPVHIHNSPPGLTVTVDGQPVRLPMTLARGQRSYTLRFAAPDHGVQQIVVDGNQPSHEIQLDLPALVKPKAATKSTPPPLTRDHEPQTPVRRPPPKPAARSRIITDF